MKKAIKISVFMISLLAAASAFGQANSRENSFKTPKDWKLFSNREFSFYAPGSLTDENLRAKDSLIGKFTNEEMVVEFDYGWFCNSCGICDKPVTATIDDKSAAVCTYEDEKAEPDKKYAKTVRFSKLGFKGAKTLAFLIYCKTLECQADAEKIVRSIKFK